MSSTSTSLLNLPLKPEFDKPVVFETQCNIPAALLEASVSHAFLLIFQPYLLLLMYIYFLFYIFSIFTMSALRKKL